MRVFNHHFYITHVWIYMLSYQWTFWNWQSKPRSIGPTTMSRDYLSLKRNSDGAPILENSSQTEGMRRILHKRRKWGEPPVLGGRKEYSTWEATAELSLLKRNSSGILFLVDSTRGGNEEDSPFSEEKRSPPLEEDKIKVE